MPIPMDGVTLASNKKKRSWIGYMTAYFAAVGGDTPVFES
jgi:hypothetical protein